MIFGTPLPTPLSRPHMWTTKMEISLCIHTVWSVPLLWEKQDYSWKLWKFEVWFHTLESQFCDRKTLGWALKFIHSFFKHLQLRHLMTKPTKWPVRPVKTQISLGIHPIRSESSLSTWRNIGPLSTSWAHSENSDQTGRMSRLIWVFAGHTYHFVGFVMRRLS